MRRWAVRVLALLTLGFLAFVLIVSRIPISANRIDRLVQRAFSERTDLEIRFTHAVAHLAKGRLDLADVTISDPLTSQSLIHTDSVRLRWRWQPLNLDRPARLVDVEVAAPAPQRVYLTTDTLQLRPDADLQRLRQVIGRMAGPPRVSPARPQPLGISVTPMDVYLHAGTPDNPAGRILGLESSHLKLVRDDAGQWRARLQTRLAGKAPAPAISLDIWFRHVGDVFYVAAHWDDFVPGERVRWPGMERLRGMPATDARAVFEIAPGATTLTLRAANISALGSQLRLWGSLGLSAPHRYDVAFKAPRISPQALNRFARSIRAPLPELDTGWLEGNGRLSGARHRFEPARAHAAIKGRRITLKLAQAPAALGPLEFDARLASGSLSLTKVSLQAGDSHFQGRARIENLFRPAAQPMPLRAFWTAEMRLDEILGYLPPAVRELVDSWQPQGSAWGSGSISAECPASKWLNMGNANKPLHQSLRQILACLRIDGQVRLDRVRLRMPHLHAPLHDVAGRVSIANEAIDFSRLEARLLGSRIQLSGRVAGNPLLTDAPQLQLDIEGDLDLEQAPRWLDARQSAALRRFEPRGSVALDLFARGPLARPADIAFEGSIAAQGLAASIALPMFRANLSDGEAQLRLTPEAAHLDRLSARIGGLTLRTSGTLERRRLALSVATSGKLDEYAQALPALPRSWHIEGPVALGIDIDIAAEPQANYPQGPTAIANLVQYLRPIWDAPGGAARSPQPLNDFAIAWRGRGQAMGCTIRQPHMPQPVTNIHGRFEFDQAGIRTAPQARARWGGAETTTRGSIEIDSNRHLRLAFEVETPDVNADEWVRAWHYRPHRPPAKQHAPQTKRQEPESEKGEKKPPFPEQIWIDGRIRAKHYTLKRLEGTDGEMALLFTDRLREDQNLWVNHITGSAYQGQFEVDTLRIQTTRGADMHWTLKSARFTDMRSKPFLKALLPGDSPITGVLSAELADMAGRGAELATVTGGGRFAISDSSFQKNAIFSALAKTLRSKELENLAETDMEGQFEMDRGTVRIPRLRLRGSVLQMDAQGRAGLDGRIDLTVIYRLFGRLRLPIVQQVMGAIEHLGSYFFKVHIGGTLHDPDITAVPLSIDKLPGFKDPWFDTPEAP